MHAGLSKKMLMILKLELSRVQAELDATYELVQKGIAKMEPPKAAEVGPSDLLVDFSTEDPAKESQYNIFPYVATKCHDLSVLITDFPIPQEAERGDDAFEQEKAEIRDISDIVNVVVELMKKRFGSSSKDTKDEKSELAELNKLVHMMQPLYNIGLAILSPRRYSPAA